MVRPHFAYPTPAGYRDQNADYPFDLRQAPGTDGDGTLPAQGETGLILRLDSDADFLWRSLIWIYPDNYCLLAGQVGFRIKEPYGRYLSSDYVPALALGQSYFVLQPWIGANAATPPTGPTYLAPLTGGMGVVLENEIFCPASSVIRVDAISLSQPGETCSQIGRLIARGVKRRPESSCGGSN
jgi:hypothetical protein